MKKTRILATLASLSLLFTAISAQAASGGPSDQHRAEHQRIVEFWTHERVAQAVPRDFVLDITTGKFAPSRGKPPGTPGGGGGGDDSGVVTGSSWNGGGEVDGAVGKVLFEMDGSFYVCSATVIDDGSDDSGQDDTALILTAAHCVYDEVNGAFAGMWMFVPDYDNDPAPLTATGSFCADTTHGCWTAQAMAVHSGYATAGGFNDQAVLYDFAVVRVGPGGLDDNSELDQVVKEQGYSFSALSFGTTGYAFGYPAQKKWKGNDLIYCAGPIDGDPYNDNKTYRLNECKLNGGSSGGGWMAPFSTSTGSGILVSVNSYGYTGVNAMHGPILNQDTQDVYNAATGGGGIVP